MASEGSRLLDEALKLMAEAIKVKLAEMEPTSDVASASALAKGTFTPEEVAKMELNSGVASASTAVEGTNILGEISVDAKMELNIGVASSSASSKGSVTLGDVGEEARVESTALAFTRCD